MLISLLNLILTNFFRYAHFFNDEELGKVNEFLSNNANNLNDFKQKIEYYHNLSRDISLEIERTSFTEFFEINYNSFIETVTNNVKSFKNAIVDRLVSQYHSVAKR